VPAQLKEKNGNEWVAVKEIEMKLGIKRMLGNFTVGDEETYTSDSTEMASAEFKRDSKPGDEKGNLILVARVEDNDDYCNLVAEKSQILVRHYKGLSCIKNGSENTYRGLKCFFENYVCRTVPKWL